MHALRAADEAHRGDAVAESAQRIVRRFDNGRMIREAEVVVGAQIDHFAAVGEHDDRTLRGADEQLMLQKPRGVECSSLALESFTKFLEHCILEIIGVAARR